MLSFWPFFRVFAAVEAADDGVCPLSGNKYLKISNGHDIIVLSPAEKTVNRPAGQTFPEVPL